MPAPTGLSGAARAHGPWLGLGALLGAGFAALWWLLLAFEAFPASSVEEMRIPPGTADAIERGVPFAFVPERYAFPPGGKLRVTNEDSVEHRVADTVIPPGRTADVTPTESGQFVCTVHPARHVEIELQSRPPTWAMAGLVGAMAVGTMVVGSVIRSN